MGTEIAATQLSLLCTQEEIEATTAMVPARAKRREVPPAHGLEPARPSPKLGEIAFVERRAGHSRRPLGLGGRRAADRVESRCAEEARDAPASIPSPSSPLPPENELWDLRAAARFLKLSTSWVYKRVEDGTLPVTRVNGYSLRFDPAALRAWVSNNGSTRRAVGRKKK
jgi:excisionase family DNA binding protein